MWTRSPWRCAPRAAEQAAERADPRARGALPRVRRAQARLPRSRAAGPAAPRRRCPGDRGRWTPCSAPRRAGAARPPARAGPEPAGAAQPGPGSRPWPAGRPGGAAGLPVAAAGRRPRPVCSSSAGGVGYAVASPRPVQPQPRPLPRRGRLPRDPPPAPAAPKPGRTSRPRSRPTFTVTHSGTRYRPHRSRPAARVLARLLHGPPPGSQRGPVPALRPLADRVRDQAQWAPAAPGDVNWWTGPGTGTAGHGHRGGRHLHPARHGLRDGESLSRRDAASWPRQRCTDPAASRPGGYQTPRIRCREHASPRIG